MTFGSAEHFYVVTVRVTLVMAVTSRSKTASLSRPRKKYCLLLPPPDDLQTISDCCACAALF